jgi:hypothetical protein
MYNSVRIFPLGSVARLRKISIHILDKFDISSRKDFIIAIVDRSPVYVTRKGRNEHLFSDFG